MKTPPREHTSTTGFRVVVEAIVDRLLRMKSLRPLAAADRSVDRRRGLVGTIGMNLTKALTPFLALVRDSISMAFGRFLDRKSLEKSGVPHA